MSSELISFMQRDLVLRYKWLPNLKLSDESKRGLDWLSDERNRSRRTRLNGSGSRVQ